MFEGENRVFQLENGVHCESPMGENEAEYGLRRNFARIYRHFESFCGGNDAVWRGFKLIGDVCRIE